MSVPTGFKTRALDSVRRLFTKGPLENVMFSALRGSEYGGTMSRFIPNPHLYPAGSMRSATRDGINYELDLSCMMQWYVFWDFKEKQRDRLYSLIRPGDVVLDVGTNIGETLLHFARLVGETGKAYGFEPDQHNYANVKKNISLNPFKNLQVFNLGVSDKKETVKLFRVDPHNLGMNRILTDEEASKFDDFTTIEVDTIDNVIAANGIDNVDLIKIDIEGYEMHALRGARNLLDSQHPKLFIEVGYTRLLKNETSPNEMIAYLQGFGYEVRHAETDEMIGADYDFSPLGDGGIDVYAVAK